MGKQRLVNLYEERPIGVNPASYTQTGTQSQYDVGLLPGMDINQYRADQQTGWDKLGNGLFNMGTSAFTGAMESTLGLAVGLTSALATQDVSNLYNNPFGQTMDALNEMAREAAPFYQTEEEKAMGLGESMGTANFWFDKVLGGAGYTVGSLAAGYGMANVFKALQAGKAAKFLAGADEALGSVQGLAGEAASAGRKLMAQEFATGIVMAHGESSMEARGTYKETTTQLAELRDKGREGDPEFAQYANLTDEEIDKYGKDAASSNYIMNMAVTGPTDMMLLGKWINPGKKEAARLYNEIGTDIAEDGTKSYFDKTLRNKARALTNFAEKFAKGALTEGGQEGSQFASNIAAREFVEKYQFEDKSWLESITSGLIEGFKETLTSREGQESMLIGGLTGGAFGLKGGNAERLAKEKNTENKIKAMTGFSLEDESISPKVQAYLSAVKSANASEGFLKQGDIFEAKNKSEESLNTLIKYHIDNGTEDFFVAKLEAIKETEDLAKYFGEGTTAQDIDKVIAKVSSLSQLNDSIDNIFGISSSNPELRQINSLLKERLFHTATVIQDVDTRIKSIKDTIDKNFPDAKDVITKRDLHYNISKAKLNDEAKKLGKEVKEYYKEYQDRTFKEYEDALTVYKENNPTKATGLEELVGDLNQLDSRRMDYVKAYNALNDPKLAKDYLQAQQDILNELTKEFEKQAKQNQEDPVDNEINDVLSFDEQRENKTTIGEEEIDLSKLTDEEFEELQINLFNDDMDGKKTPVEVQDAIQKEEEIRKVNAEKIAGFTNRINKANSQVDLDKAIEEAKQAGFKVDEAKIKEVSELIKQREAQREALNKVDSNFKGAREFLEMFSIKGLLKENFDKYSNTSDFLKHISISVRKNPDFGKRVPIGDGAKLNTRVEKISPKFIVELQYKNEPIGNLPWHGQYVKIGEEFQLDIQKLTEKQYRDLFLPPSHYTLEKFKDAHNNSRLLYEHIAKELGDKESIDISVEEFAKFAKIGFTRGDYNVIPGHEYQSIENFLKGENKPYMRNGVPIVVSTSTFEGASPISTHNNDNWRPASILDDRGIPVGDIKPSSTPGEDNRVPELRDAFTYLANLIVKPKAGNFIHNTHWILIEDPNGSLEIPGEVGKKFDWSPIVPSTLEDFQKNELFEKFKQAYEISKPGDKQKRTDKTALNRGLFIALREIIAPQLNTSKRFKSMDLSFALVSARQKDDKGNYILDEKGQRKIDNSVTPTFTVILNTVPYAGQAESEYIEINMDEVNSLDDIIAVVNKKLPTLKNGKFLQKLTSDDFRKELSAYNSEGTKMAGLTAVTKDNVFGMFESVVDTNQRRINQGLIVKFREDNAKPESKPQAKSQPITKVDIEKRIVELQKRLDEDKYKKEKQDIIDSLTKGFLPDGFRFGNSIGIVEKYIPEEDRWIDVVENIRLKDKDLAKSIDIYFNQKGLGQKIIDAHTEYKKQIEPFEEKEDQEDKAITDEQIKLLSTKEGILIRKDWSLGKGLGYTGEGTEGIVEFEDEDGNKFEAEYYSNGENDEWIESSYFLGKTKQEVIDKINAKYDAELAALENTKPVSDKKADIERRRQERRGDALEKIGVSRVGYDGKQRQDWKDAKNQDLKIATNHAIERLSKNPNVKIGSLPSSYSNAIKAELEIRGVNSNDKTPISEIIEKLKEINAKYDAELAALKQPSVDTTVTQLPNLNTSTKNPPPSRTGNFNKSNDISDGEYNNFIDKGIVSQDRINIIAEKIKNNTKLSERETAIFNDKTGEINKVLQELKTNSNKPDPNTPAFSAGRITDEERITLEQAVVNLKTILPSWIAVEELDTLLANLGNGTVAFGKFENNIIKLSKFATVGTEYHEAFHAVFRAMLNNAQRSALYSEVKDRLRKQLQAEGLSFNEGLKRFSSEHSEYSNLSREGLEAVYLEEYMANKFQNFMSKPESKPTTLLGKLFKAILDLIKFIKGQPVSLDMLFEQIKAGAYKHASPTTGQTVFAVPAYKSIKIGSKTDDEGKSYDVMLNPSLQETIESTIANKVFSEREDKIGEGVEYLIDDLINSAITVVGSKFNISSPVYDDLYDKYIESPAVYETQFRNLQNLNELFYGNSDVALAARAELKDNVITKLKEYGVSQYQSSEDINDPEDNDGSNNITERNFDLNSENIGGFGSLSKALRKYIALTQYDVTLNEFFGLPDGHIKAFDETIQIGVNAKRVYDGIVKMAANQAEPIDVLKRMHYFRDQSNESSRFLDKFFTDAGIQFKDGEFIAKNHEKDALIQRVVSGFNLYAVDYKFLHYDSNNNIMDIYDANRNDVDSLQLRDWNHQYIDLIRYDKAKFTKNLNEAKKKLSEISNLYAYIKDGDNVELDNLIKNSKKVFASIGIKLSPLYLKYYILAGDRVKNVEQQDFVTSFENSLKLSKTEFYNNMNAILNVMEQGNSPFERKKLNKDDKGDIGSVTRLLQIAKDNAVFDETIYVTSMQNAEGKTIYPYQKPNFHHQYMDTIRNGDPKQNKEAPSQDYLDNNFLWENEEFKAVRSELRLSNIDGTRQEDLEIDEKTGEKKRKKTTKTAEGVTYGSMTPRELAVFVYSSFNNGKLINKITKNGMVVRVREFLFNIMEASNTANMITLPVHNVIDSNGRFTDTFHDFIFNEIQREYNRIQNVANGKYQDRYHKFNWGDKESKLRGLKFWENDLLLSSSPDALRIKAQLEKGEITPANVRADLKKITEDYYNKEFAEHLSYLEEFGLITKEGGKIENRLLPKEYTGVATDEKLDFVFNSNSLEANIKYAYFNMLVNNTAINQLFMGDPALTLKDPIDWFKRARGNNATGANMLSVTNPKNKGKVLTFGNLDADGVFDEIKTSDHIKTKKIIRIDSAEFEELLDEESKTSNKTRSQLRDEIINKHGKDGKIAIMDAQGYTSDKGYINFLKRLGKLTTKGEEIYTKMSEGKKITKDEWKYLKDNQIIQNSLKLVYFDGETYIKLSVAPIPKEMVEDVHGNAIKGMETLYKLRNTIEKHDIDIAGPPSMMKKLLKNPYVIDPNNIDFDGVDENNLQVIDYTYLRLQQENPSNKDQIKDPTQMTDIITAEQDRPTAVTLKNGKESTVGAVLDRYNDLLVERLKTSHIPARAFIAPFIEATNSRSLDLKKVTALFKMNLESTGASPLLMDMLATNDDGTPIHNFNLPDLVTQFERLYNAHYNNVFMQKIPGYKVTLMSGFGFNVIEDTKTGKIIQFDEYRKNPTKYASDQYQPRKLKYDQPRIINGKEVGRYSEVVLPAHFAELFNLKEGDPIPEEIAYMFGVRIPSQDKHSGMSLKVVGFLPAQMGSTMIFPDELVILTGSDFDIDSFYIHRPDHYVKRIEVLKKGEVNIKEITPEDKIIWGHPTIGKSFLKQKGDNRFITLDDDYADEINNFIDRHKGNQTRQEYKGKKPKEYNEFMINLFDRLKKQAREEGKKLFVSNTNILKERMSEFDKVITMPKDEFKKRFEKRGSTYGFEDWKSDIDNTVAKVDKSKVINTSKYLADLFSTITQVSSEEQFKFMVYGNNEDSKWEQFKTWHTANNKLLKKLISSDPELIALFKDKELAKYNSLRADLNNNIALGNSQKNNFDEDSESLRFDALNDQRIYNSLSKEAKERVNSLRKALVEKYMKQLELPSTKEEFDSNPMRTLGEINNELLDAKIILHTNSHINKTIAKTPATLDAVKEVLKALASKLGYTTWEQLEKTYQANSLMGQLTAFLTNKAGSTAIGSAVNNTKIYTILSRFGLVRPNDKNPTVIDGLTMGNISTDMLSTTDSERIMDILSTLTSAMTDNTKYGYNSKMNVDINTLSILSYLTMSRVPIKTSTWLINQEAIKKYSNETREYALQSQNETNFKGDAANRIATKYFEKAQNILNKLVALKAIDASKYKLENYDKTPITFEELDMAMKSQFNKSTRENKNKVGDQFDIDIFNIESLIDPKQTVQAEQLMNYYMTQYKVMKTYERLSKESAEITRLTQALKLTKGVSSSTKDTSFRGDEEIEYALKSIGFKLVEQHNGSFIITEDDSIHDEDKSIFNFKHILENYKIGKENLYIFAEKQKLAKKEFISRSNFARNLKDAVSLNIRKKMSTEKRTKILAAFRRNLETFLISKIHRNKIESKLGKVNFNAFLYDDISTKEGVENIVRMKERLFNDRRFADLLDTAWFRMVEYKIGDDNTVQVNYNSRGKGNAGFEAILANEFHNLFSADYADADVRKEMQDFALAHTVYLLAKDGMQYKNNSFVSILPEIMKRALSYTLNDITKSNVLNATEDVTYKEVFGEGSTKKGLEKEFLEMFFRDINTKQYLEKKIPLLAGVFYSSTKESEAKEQGKEYELKNIHGPVKVLARDASKGITKFQIKLVGHEASGLTKEEQGKTVGDNKKILTRKGIEFNTRDVPNPKNPLKNKTQVLFPMAILASQTKGSSKVYILKSYTDINGKLVEPSVENWGDNAIYEETESIGSLFGQIPYFRNKEENDEASIVNRQQVVNVLKEAKKTDVEPDSEFIDEGEPVSNSVTQLPENLSNSKPIDAKPVSVTPVTTDTSKGVKLSNLTDIGTDEKASTAKQEIINYIIQNRNINKIFGFFGDKIGGIGSNKLMEPNEKELMKLLDNLTIDQLTEIKQKVC